MVLLWVLLTCSCLLAFKLSMQFFSPLSSISLPARLQPSSSIPYGSYLQGLVQAVTCQQPPATLFAMLTSLESCPLPAQLRIVESLEGKIVLLSEELESQVPEDMKGLVVILANETAAILARNPSIVLRADFSGEAREQPLWEIASSADPYIWKAISPFLPSNCTVQIRDIQGKGTELWINGVDFEGGKADLQRALCASFSYPPAACKPLFCAPHCWAEMLGNGICDPVCFNANCQYDYKDCTRTPRGLRRRPYTSSSSTTYSSSSNSTSSCDTTACAVGVSIAVIVFCLGG